MLHNGFLLEGGEGEGTIYTLKKVHITKEGFGHGIMLGVEDLRGNLFVANL